MKPLALCILLASAATSLAAASSGDSSAAFPGQTTPSPKADFVLKSTAALAGVRRNQDCLYVPVAGDMTATMDPLEGLTVRSQAPLPEGKFLQLPQVVDSAGQDMPACAAITSAADAFDDATLDVKRTSLAKCSSEGRDGMLYLYIKTGIVSASSACRGNATKEHPYGYNIEELYKCIRIKKGVTSTVAATTWGTIKRTCNTCRIIQGTVQPQIVAAEPNGIVGDDYTLVLSFDNVDGEKKIAFETVIDKVTLYAGGKSLEVSAFEVEWLDASRVAVTFKLFKVTSNPQTDIVVTATHTWNLRRRAFARHMVNNATSESRSLREHSGRRMSIARRAVDNETAETSEHSVVVYIDNAKETPVLLLVVVIGFGSMMLLCMGLIFIAYRWVKRNFNGANVLPGKQDTLVANGKHDTLVAKTEVNGIVMSCAPAAPVVLDAMVGYRLEGFA